MDNMTDEPRCTVCQELKTDCRRLWSTDHIFGWPQPEYRDRDAEKIADAKQYARQALGDAKADGPRRAEEREHKPSEGVEELRAAVAAGSGE